MKTILLMVALNATDYNVERAIVLSDNLSSLSGCMALAEHMNQTSDLYWFCLEETK